MMKDYSTHFRELVERELPDDSRILLHRDQTESRFAYGAGAQVKLDRFALRVEYEVHRRWMEYD
jgi:hypothetical protein